MKLNLRPLPLIVFALALLAGGVFIRGCAQMHTEQAQTR
jgi:hypothetical protein